jgi:hypothetical protein
LIVIRQAADGAPAVAYAARIGLHLGWSFAMVFAAAALLAAIAFLTALLMPNTPLRGKRFTLLRFLISRR